MDANAITAEAVRETLNTIRSAQPLDDAPLVALVALGPALAAARTDDTPAARLRLLPRWLEEVTATHLARVRGEGQPAGPAHVAAEEALERLADDFASESREREVWATLHFRFFSGSQVSLLELADMLGVSRRTLRRRIASGYAALAEVLRDLEREAEVGLRRGHNVPAERTRFIGREAELAAIRRLLAAHRSVTLKGPGGVGKSRLAARLARDLGPDYADGVWFVELAAVGEDRQVPGAVMAALGVQEQPGRALTATLAEHLAERRTLLVLDNCEHVVRGSGELVGALLARSASLQVLATSRQELGLEAEAVYEVPPLALPPEGEREQPERALHYDAVRLFGSRAMAAAPAFRLEDGNAGQVTRLCARLEGIPLAIELAAVRAQELTLQQIEARLEDRFQLLRDGRHARRPGHETLQAALDVSYDLLGEAERALLCRLSVFRGGWTLEAAEAVCSGEGVEPGDVLELLAELEAKSLIDVRHESGRPRYRVLETVRQYARDRLRQSASHMNVLDRHLDYFVALAERMEPEVEGGRRQAECLQRLREEGGNLDAALGHAVSAVRAERGLRLTGALPRYWRLTGQLTEGKQRLERMLVLSSGRAALEPHAKAVYALGVLAFFQGEYPRARAAFQESLALSEATGDGHRAAYCLNQLGLISVFEGNVQEARGFLEPCLAMARDRGDKDLLARVYNNLGLVTMEQGELEDAEKYFEESLECGRGISDRSSRGYTLMNLGTIVRLRGDFDLARTYYGRSLDVHAEIGYEQGMAATLGSLGWTAAVLGDHEDAQDYFQRSIALSEDLGDRFGVAFNQCGLGAVYIGRGDFVGASKLLSRALTVFLDLGDSTNIAETLQLFAEVFEAQGSAVKAVRLLGAAEALHPRRSLTQKERSKWESQVQQLQEATGEPMWRTEMDHGRLLHADEAVAYALGEVPWAELEDRVAARSQADSVDGEEVVHSGD